MSTTAGEAGALGSGDESGAVAAWLRDRGLACESIEALPGDLSLRRYARLRLRGEARTRILARYPASMRDAQRRFAEAAALLASAGIRVPEIAIDDREAGLSLIEDFGARTLYESTGGWAEAREWLDGSLDVLERLRGLDVDRVVALGSPALDATLLRSELERPLGLLLGPGSFVDDRLTAALGDLCDRLGRLPLVPCHRDYMARNLVPLEKGRVGVLDFQDLRLGPLEYDRASLLNDSLFADEALEDSVLGDADREAYGRAVVQRSLKAAGTFVALAAEGKPQHLPLVGRSLERAATHLGRLPETRHAFGRLADRWRGVWPGEGLLV